MQHYDIYKDIAGRTGGDIYIGVVGPVRTGKSTFIKRFMETLVLDHIEDPAKKTRAIDELPQSADGKTIMTTEPKFVPNEAITLSLDKTVANVRLIDCVGYLVDGALGHVEDDKPRLVKTPWSEAEMPFQEAAEIGTEKVIREHSTIGIVVTTDGSVTELSRVKYTAAEERVVAEMKAMGKPFTVVLNSKHPEKAETVKLAAALAEKYGVPVRAVNVQKASAEDFGEILLEVLMEFPVCRVDIDLPRWMRALDRCHPMIADILTRINADRTVLAKMRDYEKLSGLFEGSEVLEEEPDVVADSANGTIKLRYRAKEGVFYRVLAGECNAEIGDDYQLMSYVIKAGKAYNEYEKIRTAIESVKETGYGIVMPTTDEMVLDEPEVVKKGAQFGVRLKASAPSLHLVRVDVETEVSPVIGTEQQSEDLLSYINERFEADKQAIWETDFFGRPLSALVREDLSGKVGNMPKDAQKKLRRTMTRIVNEGKGGVLCILL